MKRLFILILSLTTLLVGCSDKLPIETDMSKNVQDFTFTTQDHDELSLADLKGNWWIADFIFTNCETVCLPMTSNMSYLQDLILENELDLQFVSFSVDPEYDSPEVLKEYGQEYDVDFTNWSFLTGYDFDTIKEISVKSFQAPVLEPESGSDQVTHDVRFFLVNPEGVVVKSYDGLQQDNMEEILEDMQALEDEGLL